ncbi:hypothetical protein TD95_004482 [Thielaviopsis punctulata]|uniref:Molybdopterin synthase sulfur carrier subunit n=1 Tax=Thielaviopsis punctulata TaxID=72032 RepID=A0A0F4Z9E2_9PEZI|nr:hypothetical protein TD95_004482 [Thielaviopsis punctulata]
MSQPNIFTILYFAAAADFTGKDSEQLVGPIAMTELFGKLEPKYPEITKAILNGCMVAVNGRYVDPTDKELEIKVGDEVAIIPPVSSG